MEGEFLSSRAIEAICGAVVMVAIFVFLGWLAYLSNRD